MKNSDRQSAVSLVSTRRILTATFSLFIVLATGCGHVRKSVPNVTGDARVDALLSEMTLQEKISLTHGAEEPSATNQGEAGYLPGVPRLGIPPLRFTNGPPGVLTRIPALAPTCTMGLAATFSREDARENGILFGRQAKARGIQVVLEPFLNMDRDLTFYRDYNTFGEDPLLTGELGAAEIEGTRSQGIMSQAKHYVAYDTEGKYGAGDVAVDQQALHEIYLAPFADAVMAHVASLMCSYSIVNGNYSCGSSRLLTTILRQELGFKGFVTSDWGATHSVTYINDGLDVEMPGPIPIPETHPQAYRRSYFAGNELPAPPNPPKPSKLVRMRGLPEEPPVWRISYGISSPPSSVDLIGAIKMGRVSEATVTRAAGRVLYQMDRFGYLSHPPNYHVTRGDIDANTRIILKTGEDAAVLLKNQNNALPLTQRDLKSLVMIGPGAGQIVAVGEVGEKAVGLPSRQVGPLEALKKDTAMDPGAHISYAVADDMTGVLVPPSALSHHGEPGLVRTVAGGNGTQVDRQINFTHSSGKLLPANSSFEWKGTLNVPSSGAYRLHLQLFGAFGTLSIDGKQIVRIRDEFLHGDITQAGADDLLPTTDGLDNARAQLNLTKGPHAISLAIKSDGSDHPEQVRLNWLSPDQRKADFQAAVAAARKVSTAVVFAWSRGVPHFGLPDDQDRLIKEVSRVNPNTIVVLNVSQPVALPWLDNVKAVLQMWWPGDEGGWATANILLGNADPAGRLPFTWPKRLADTPVNDPAHPERQEGSGGKAVYSEGIFIGYRWFDKQDIRPLFPFGYGLSYTRFVYSGLEIVPDQSGGLAVSFEVKNVGQRAGDEVPQVYLSAPSNQPKGVQFAVRSLAGFDRIHLNPAESKMVRLHVPLRSLQYWSIAKNCWIRAVGERTVYAGSSSRDLPLRAIVRIAK